MTYFDDMYPRFYNLTTSPESWMIYLLIMLALGLMLLASKIEGKKHANTVFYYFLIFLVVSFAVRLILWVLLPSPEFLGIVK